MTIIRVVLSVNRPAAFKIQNKNAFIRCFRAFDRVEPREVLATAAAATAAVSSSSIAVAAVGWIWIGYYCLWMYLSGLFIHCSLLPRGFL